MNHESTQQHIQYDEDYCPRDEYDPVERWENELLADTTVAGRDLGKVTNDDFLSAIFGSDFSNAYPIVCKKSGDPDKTGWYPMRWPCSTDDASSNWYCQPSLYRADHSGAFRAKKEFAISVHAVMLDDIGTKVNAEKLSGSPPSWSVETSPGNFQYGYIFSEPITDLIIADRLKEQLITAGLCDSGATGGAARWMRLPVAINGRPKYGHPSPQCKLIQWRPELRYTVVELQAALGLDPVQSSIVSNNNSITTATDQTPQLLSTDTELILSALKEKGLYKRFLGQGKHDITCPWVIQHTDATDNGAAYLEPNQSYPTGGFKCHHSHGNLFHIRELREFLQINNPAASGVETQLPQKLPPSLRLVPTLDPKHLPDALQDAVIDLADRLQCPMDYIAVAMLSAAGAVVGNKVGIFPYANDESWEVYPALWGGIVGDPGSKKSPSIQHAHKPLRHLENQASQKYAQDMQVYEQAQKQYEDDLSSWKKKGVALKPAPAIAPKRERYVVHDSTYQALGVILSDNPRGILALADELSGLLQSLDTSGQEAARGFYLTGWGGSAGYSFDRIGRGSITLDRYCLSVFGGFQPDRIKAYVQLTQRGSSKNDGLLQRFQLLVWPDHVGNFKLIDRAPDKVAINKYHQAVISLPDKTTKSIQSARPLSNGSQLLHFSVSAQQAFNNWYVQNEIMLTDGKLDTARQSHFAKYRSLIPALALLFHLLDSHEGPVCEDCLSRAVMFAKYLKHHADRIYASATGHDHAAVRLLAERLLDQRLSTPFTHRSLMHKGWTGLASKEQAQAAIDALVEYGWLSETEIRSGGRPTVKYSLDPSASALLL
jgi:putative DNA primase/helicase